MSEVAEQTLTVDTLKIAILAALNIADNYVSKREEYEQLERNVSDSTGRLNRFLISSLDKMGSSWYSCIPNIDFLSPAKLVMVQ